MKRFLLADDHSIVRTGIKILIQDHYVNPVIDEAADGNEISDYFKNHRYDLAIIDINMPETDFVTLIPWIRATDPDCRILVFTTYPAASYGVRSIHAGADGFMNKTAANEDIVKAIQTLLAGKKYIVPELADILISPHQGIPDSNPVHTLSSREMEIARLMQNGLSLPEIGKQLNLGYSTIVTYKNRIFTKLKVKNVLSLARLLELYGFRD